MARTVEQVEQELNEARAALHARMTGQAVKSVSDDGSSVSYEGLSVKELNTYIAQLQAEFQMLGGAKRRRPSRPMF